MLRTWRACVVFCAALTGVAAVIAFCEFHTFSCDPKLIGETTCFEFWLNRYQTLISAVVAGGAAWYAGLWVSRQLSATSTQIELAREQIDIAREQTTFTIGLSQPVFRLSATSDWYPTQNPPRLTVHCENFNRHGIEIMDAVCVEPSWLTVALHTPRALIPGSAFSRSVRGWNPGGEVARTKCLLDASGKIPADVLGTTLQISLKIFYRLSTPNVEDLSALVSLAHHFAEA